MLYSQSQASLVLKLCLRRVFSVFEHKVLLGRHQESGCVTTRRAGIAAAQISNLLSEGWRHPEPVSLASFPYYIVFCCLIHVCGSCSGCTPLFLSCSSLRMLWYAVLLLARQWEENMPLFTASAAVLPRV